ncbi:MAG: sodium:calcium antiporter, partial [Pirellulaceae bacterium]
KSPSTIVRDVIFVVVGLGLLIAGSDLFVSGATEIAESLGVSQLVIGLTIVAIGTSLPEVATSILASLKGERDIAVGNVVGSNIFNILAVLGITSVISSNGVAAADVAVRFDIPIMTGVAVILAPIIFSKREVSRWEGVLFLGYYVAYTVYLILDANGSSQAGNFRVAMLGVVVPLTFLAVFLVAGREFLHLRKNGGIRGPQAAH